MTVMLGCSTTPVHSAPAPVVPVDATIPEPDVEALVVSMAEPWVLDLTRNALEQRYAIRLERLEPSSARF